MSVCVLIVDDEKMPRDILTHYLPWEALGVDKVLTADDGEKALSLVRTARPNIIISDVKMPRMNGLQLAEAVRDICPDSRFVFLSGYSDKDYLKGAIRLKAASYVEKPIDLEEIKQVLHDLIAEMNRLTADSRLIFFRGSTENPIPLNNEVFELNSNYLSGLENLLKKKKRAETEAALKRLCNVIRRCEGTEIDFIRHVYCKIVFLLLSASKNYGVAEVLKQSDFLLYTAVKYDTLSKLWKTLLEAAALYFDKLEQDFPDLISRVNSYLERHFAESSLSVQSMARDIGFSNTYLCAAYKKESGVTINRKLTALRIGRAKTLLGSPGVKLYEVAKAVGYRDGKYFTKVFTRETGLSPKEYRERHRYEE